MRSGIHFDIEFEVGDIAAARVRQRVESEAEAMAFARTHLVPNSELLVACIGGGVDYGNLIIEVGANGDSNVYAHEHRGFLAKRVSRERALSALEYWLPSQDRMPDLQWVEE